MSSRVDFVAITRMVNLLVFAALLVLLAACDFTPTAGPAAEGKAWSATCPDGQLAAFLGIDTSGSFAEKQFKGTNERVLRDLAARTATCSGHLRVVSFSNTSAQAKELFDGRLELPGATDVARWRRLPNLVDKVVSTVAERYERVVRNHHGAGSDVVAPLRLAAEFADQVGAHAYLSAVLTTDGLQSVTVSATSVTTVNEARAIADRLPVPKLAGELQVVGLGQRHDGVLVASATAELVKAFWQRICERSSANPCTTSTDYSSRVGSES